jgi:hypothetical protein
MVRAAVALLLLLTPAWAAAGPFDQPWAVIAGDGAAAPDPRYGTAVVSRVDGESVARGRAVVAPGLHSVTVALPPRKGASVGSQATFEVQANPCMHYLIAARLDGPAGEWKAVVRSAATIGECLTRFKGGTAPQ